MDDTDSVADLITIVHALLDHVHPLENGLDLFPRDGAGLLAAAARADDAGDARSITDDVPRFVGHDHLDKEITRIVVLHLGFARRGAVFVEDGNRVLRDDDAKDVFLHPHRLDTALQVLRSFLLIFRIGGDNIPRLLAQGGGGVFLNFVSHVNFLRRHS